MENEQQKKPINQSLQKKTAARTAAVQCVYGRLIEGAPISITKQVENLKERLKDNAEEQKLTLGIAIEPNYTLITAILEGTLKWSGEINKRLDSVLSKEWSRERMSPILIAILECAIFELFFFKDSNAKVIIDEYSRLTSRFFADAEVNFVNGALKNLQTKFSE